MEQTLDVRTLIERGDDFLKEARAREAAVEYARAAQMDGNAVGAHLGLAEANVALGQFQIVSMACQAVVRLAPNTADAYLAQAIDATLAQRYDQALSLLDQVAQLDPARAYTYALRGYILRQLRQTYDASLAESKAKRLSGSHDLVKLFPPVNPVVPEVFATPAGAGAASASAIAAPQPQIQAQPRPWSERSGAERTAVRARFATRNLPIVTFSLIAINVAIYLVCVAFSNFDFFTTVHTNNPLYVYGVEFPAQYMQQNPLQWYRVVTSMFLHEGLWHIGVNMLSLYFVGVVTEQIFGHWRFLGIYLAAGIIAGVVQAFFLPSIPLNYPFDAALATGNAALGASGAIFGIFGAFGAFFLLYRRVLGPAANVMLGQWAFWLIINLALDFYTPGIGIADHIGGLLSGMALATVLLPSFSRRA